MTTARETDRVTVNRNYLSAEEPPMSRPTVSWNPLRYVNSMIDEGTPTLEEVCAQARDGFGLDHIELHHKSAGARDPKTAEATLRLLDRYGLRLSQWTCAPDFTHPDRAVREQELEEMKRDVDLALIMGAPGCRVTTGCRYPEVSEEQGVSWAAEYLLRVADYAQPKNIKLGLENHYRDRRWVNEDFAFRAKSFLAVFDRVKESWIGVNFDASNQVMSGEDPMEVLEVVKHKVWHMHASDRFPGQYAHSIVGEGSVQFNPIFVCLARIEYSGYISLEDNSSQGDEGTRRGLAFIHRKIDEHWKE
jgi:sugar phosphate isomerase/epimerase